MKRSHYLSHDCLIVSIVLGRASPSSGSAGALVVGIVRDVRTKFSVSRESARGHAVTHSGDPYQDKITV
jgi:hypothetical protein